MDRLTTGIAGLDTVLGGGFPIGASVFIGGSPGTGKTLLTEQILFHQAAQGRRSLFLTTLSEPHEKLIRHAEAFSWFDRRWLGDQIELLSLYPTVEQQGLTEALELLLQSVRARRAQIVVIDGFRGLRTMAGDDFSVRRFIFDLAAKLNLLGVTCIFNGEYGRPEIDHYPEFTIADGIVWLRNDLVGMKHERWLEVVKLRGAAYLGGRHRFEISQPGIEVYPRIASLVGTVDYTPGPERLRLGTPGLDAMLNGGILGSSVTLLLGTPGTGKTLVSMQFLAEGARQGEPGLFVSFHESPSHLRYRAQSFDLIGDESFLDGSVQILYASAAELNAEAVATRICAAIDEHRIRRVVVDSVANLEATFDTAQLGDYLVALTMYLRSRGVATLLLKEIPELAGAPLTLAGLTVSVTADNILLLRHVELDGRLERIISVVKLRDSDFDASVRPYTIGRHGLVVGEPLRGVEGALTGMARLRSGETAPDRPIISTVP